MRPLFTLFGTLFGTLLVLALAAQASAGGVPFARCFDLASQRHQVDLDLLMAVASVESGWDANARSSANAHGIMQIRWPLTARHLGIERKAELYNPCLNIDRGALYLRELTDQYDQDVVLALAAYNYGPTRINDRSDIPPGVRGYVNKVHNRQNRIALQMADSAHGRWQRGAMSELIRFDRRSLADRFMGALKARVPGARLTVEREDNNHVIYLDAASLTPEDRYRLSRLVPND